MTILWKNWRLRRLILTEVVDLPKDGFKKIRNQEGSSRKFPTKQNKVIGDVGEIFSLLFLN